MELDTVSLLSVGASISNILGFILAIVTLLYFYIDRKEKLEYKIRKIFLDGKIWTNEGDIYSKDTILFNLNIHNNSAHRYSGDIESAEAEDSLTFYFRKSSGKKIFLSVHKKVGWRDIGSANAKPTFISPELFKITFSKGFRKGSFRPNLPHKTHVWSI
uniref:hypothetical protein n=1 Tax=Psychrobacter sp. TaxID=56811 RepID=UPI001599456F|nr:hypothetical protein [Psychrobacter sp.]QJS05492.1 hypothetical protein [Psychrobacter sp.]